MDDMVESNDVLYAKNEKPDHCVSSDSACSCGILVD